MRQNTTKIEPKEVYKNFTSNTGGTAAVVKDELDSGIPVNGPQPKEGIMFENKNLLIFYKR